MRELMVYGCKLTSLETLCCMALESLTLRYCSTFTQWSGLEHLSTLKSLEVEVCGVTSLRPLCCLGRALQKLRVTRCRKVQEDILELPHVQPTAQVVVAYSNVKEVVLAGGVRRVVGST
jgi:hypothetical protein